MRQREEAAFIYFLDFIEECEGKQVVGGVRTVKNFPPALTI